MAEPEGPGHCIYCGSRVWAPRWYSEYRTNGPRVEWGAHYHRTANAGYLLPGSEEDPDGGHLYLYCVCQPSCRANAAIERYDTARREIAAALEELQQAVIEALVEVSEAWRQLGD